MDVKSRLHDHEKEFKIASVCYQTRADTIETELGTKPQGLADSVNAPTAWGVLGNVVTQMGVETSRMLSEQRDMERRFVERLEEQVEKIEQDWETQLKASDRRITDLRSFLIGVAGGLQDTMVELSNQVALLSGTTGNEADPDFENRVMERLLKQDESMARFVAQTDTQAVQFGGLADDQHA
jgi:hypothetical protein